MVKGFTKKTKASSVRASAEAMKALSGNKKYNADEAKKPAEEPLAAPAKQKAVPAKKTEEDAPKIEQKDLFASPVVASQPKKPKAPVKPKEVAVKQEPKLAKPSLDKQISDKLATKNTEKTAKEKAPEVVKVKEVVKETAPVVETKQEIPAKTETVKETAKEDKKPEATKPEKEKVVPIKAPIVKKTRPELVFDNVKSGLHICNLGKSYGGKPAVRDISMVVNRGEAVGLLGPNGAGKTTSFYMTMGLIKPDYGTIELDGVDITNLPVYRRARMGIGYLPQEASIFRGMNVEENILSVLELSEPIASRRLNALESLMGEFSITHLRRSSAMALSGGERRRVEIARALASNPSFILLDEPLAGIDPVAVADIKELISHLKNRGIGVLITDHNVREALDLIDRAYIIHDGTVLMEGTPKEIVNNKEVRRVYLGEKFVF